MVILLTRLGFEVFGFCIVLLEGFILGLVHVKLQYTKYLFSGILPILLGLLCVQSARK